MNVSLISYGSFPLFRTSSTILLTLLPTMCQYFWKKRASRPGASRTNVHTTFCCHHSPSLEQLCKFPVYLKWKRKRKYPQNKLKGLIHTSPTLSTTPPSYHTTCKSN
ncbi:unnamed protein product [Vicia faba]|uniref:Uncharacterized protein n=1 Tax=Vicia faba TaxID=3906 RepID=A0AAV0ZS49_VICFA|nr:unnamed protein product [Vicia faba]